MPPSAALRESLAKADVADLREIIREVLNEERRRPVESDTDSERTQDASLQPFTPAPEPFTSRWYRHLYPHPVHTDAPQPQLSYPSFFRITDPNHLAIFNQASPQGVSPEADLLFQASTCLSHCLNLMTDVHNKVPNKEAGNLAHAWRWARGVEQMLRTRYDLIVALRKNDEPTAQALENICRPAVGVSDAARYVHSDLICKADSRKRKLESESGRRVRSKQENGVKKATTSQQPPLDDAVVVKTRKKTPPKDTQSHRERSSTRAATRQTPNGNRASTVVSGRRLTAETRASKPGAEAKRERLTAALREHISEDVRVVRRASTADVSTSKAGERFSFSHVLRDYEGITTKTISSEWYTFAGLRWAIVIFPRGDSDSKQMAVYLRCGGVVTDGRVTRRTPSQASAKYSIRVTSTIRVLKAESVEAKKALKNGGEVLLQHDLLDTTKTSFKRAGPFGTEFGGTGVHEFSEKSVVAGFPQLIPLSKIKPNYASKEGHMVIATFIKITPKVS